MFRAYPNPSNSGIINLSTSSVPTNIEIISILGSKVIEMNTNSTTTRINTTELPKGVYFVALTFENGQRLTKKIILN